MKRAFSLIELLVCVAIVAVVTGLATPVFTAMRERGKVASSLGNLHQLHLATMLYRQDYGGTEAGYAHEMGLPSIRANGSLESVYRKTPLNGRSPCGVNPTWPVMQKITYTLLYQPDREFMNALSTPWPKAIERYGERAWLFEDVNCDLSGVAYNDRFSTHRIVAVNLGGSAYQITRPLDLRLDPLLTTP